MTPKDFGLLVLGGLLVLFASTGQASILVDTVSQPAATPDHHAVNDALGNQNDQIDDPLVFTADNLLAKVDSDGDSEGSLIGSFSVWDGDGNAFDDEDKSVQFLFNDIAMVTEPFYITVKYGIDVDVYKWDTDTGDTITDNGDGTFDYQCMVYSVSAHSISHIGVMGAADSVPEPTTLAIWGTLSGLGLIAARRRKRA